MTIFSLEGAIMDGRPSGLGDDDIYVMADNTGTYMTDHNQTNYRLDNVRHCSNDIWSTNADGELLCSIKNATNKSDDTMKHTFVDVLLPSGFLIPIQCPATRTLAQLKHDVYIQTKKLPPSARLVDVSDLTFAVIGLNGERIELYNERKSVALLSSCCLPLFQLVEPKGNAEEKLLVQKISTAIGYPLVDIERQICEELSEFRLELFALSQKAARVRGIEGLHHYAFYHESAVVPLAVKPAISKSDEREVDENDFDPVQYPESPEEILQRYLDSFRERMKVMDAVVEIRWSARSDEPEMSFTHAVRLKNIFGFTSAGVVATALEHLRQIADVPPTDRPSDYILQIAGQRVFIDDTTMKITDFRYIYSSMENSRMSYLLLRRRSTVFQMYPRPPPILTPLFIRRQAEERRLKSALEFFDQKANHGSSQNADNKIKSFWDLDENLRIRFHSISKVSISGDDKVFIRVAVAVGRHLLDVQETVLIEPTKGRFMENGLLEFGVYVKDVPECAHFSFTLICVRGAARAPSSTSRSGADEPIGWVNCRLFDWRRRLLGGKQTVTLWPFPKELYDTSRARALNMHLSGPIHSTEVREPVGSIEIQVDDYKDERSTIYEFPCAETIFRFNDVLEERRLALEREMDSETQPSNSLSPSEQHIAMLKQLNTVIYQESSNLKSKLIENCTSKGSDADETKAENDEFDVDGLPFRGLMVPNSSNFRRLYVIHRCLDAARLNASDQRFLWYMRYKLQQLFPQTIVLLADCTYVWRDRERTCELYALLREWPPIKVETAIELLDGRFTDLHLRELAVKNLDAALRTDDQLSLYLLTLVQSIRYEPCASSALIRMLVHRSILSYRIAHTVFWLMRAELAHLLDQTGSRKLCFLYSRYALTLEAICRANTAHLDSTIKQVEMASQLTYLSAMVRNMGGNKEAATKRLQQELKSRKDALQYMDSPLNPIDRLGELVISECRVLGSAKMPLRLTWGNPEPMSTLTTAKHQLLFKNGDDMRQDMLTIQVMRIMDAMWKSYNCQYCMTLYDVLPMGRNIGLIQIVQNCKTLFEIQCETGPVASSLNMDTNLIHKFLYRKYDNSDRYENNSYIERVDRFSASLAGYCIATFVIGIRDRHQDNIMVAEDGRIFHIDFGHFLGHTKRKLGINRERTDFILTEHFLSTISHCKDYRKSFEFNEFRDKCTKGFLIVYDHARFYIVLFRMMLCMGLPELSTQENVDFLRDTLMYMETERSKVRDAFMQTFEQAIRGDWSVNVNWFFHSVKHI